MKVKEIDEYLEKLPRSVLLMLLTNLMKEYKQVRYQVRRVIMEMYRDHSKNGIPFPSKSRRESDA